MEKIDWEKVVEKMRVWLWVTTTTAMAVVAGIFVLFRESIPPQIPMFYSRSWGEEQLVSPIYLVLPLGICILITLITSLAVYKIKAERVLIAVISGLGIVAELIVILGTIRIIMLVT